MVSILGRNILLHGFLLLMLISMTHLSEFLGSFRMHNIKFLRLDMFLGNRVVGGYYLLFAQSLWIVHSPMLVVP